MHIEDMEDVNPDAIEDQRLPDEVDQGEELDQGEEVSDPENEQPENGEDTDQESGEEEKPKRNRPGKLERQNARLRAEVEALRNQQPTPPQEPVKLERPKSEDFEDIDDYHIALGEYGAERKRLEREQASSDAEQKQIQQDQIRTYQEKQEALLDSGIDEFADFEKVFHHDLPISPVMAETLLEMKGGHKVAYHLGKNPELSARIAEMSPIAAIQEMGRIGAKLTTKPAPTPTKSTPPTPLVKGGDNPNKDPKDMSMGEYVKWRESND
ncbi:hypothetical protein [Curvivirga aplysinae]|uniref:hypothetical protein n=1 Tax=Curvivirga aplysinae TaxID=2529852 RepID=UPI0012BC5242|nr:hypothetical protein [Curvivirga aplysinae]MTI10196.1 hypothetical protein [Curvivirga aplysinae]